MNTNLVPPNITQQVTNAANAFGFSVTEEQVSVILGITLISYRWISIEIKLIQARGGIKLIWFNFWSTFWGKSKKQQTQTENEKINSPSNAGGYPTGS